MYLEKKNLHEKYNQIIVSYIWRYTEIKGEHIAQVLYTVGIIHSI